jgi:hypothetical protein
MPGPITDSMQTAVKWFCGLSDEQQADFFIEVAKEAGKLEPSQGDQCSTEDSNAPRAYDLSDPAEILRLYRECRDYLRLCHHKHGTDWEGRKLAIEALNKLAQ